MTHTNRSMSEPPTQFVTATATERRLPEDTGFIDPDDAGSMVMLSAVIIAGMVLTFILALGWAHHHYVQGRIDRLQADLRALNTFTSCEAPAKPGDTTVITIRRTDAQLATRCQVITNPTAPERALKGPTL